MANNYGYPIPLRNLPGIGRIEWEIAQHGWSDETEEWAEDLGIDLFGLDIGDTVTQLKEDGSAWIGGVEVNPNNLEEIARRESEWEKHFEVLRYFRDESDAYWLSVGWDVTDGAGKQLEVMRVIGRQLVCFVKRIHPEAYATIGDEGPADDAEAWGAKLAEEARLFKPKR